MDISLVIPVYNVEKYLPRCLDSVCAQSHIVKEIILVNDGSTDNSLQICQEYADSDNRIKIINQKNQGVELAIINGINAATSEYVGFVDSDDYIEPDMFELLADSIKQSGAEIAISYYDVVDENDNVIRKRNLNTESGVYDKCDGQFPLKLLPKIKDDGFISASRWNKLILRNLLLDKLYYGNSGLRVGEDLVLIIPTVMSATKIACVDKYLYHYVLHNNSAMRNYKSRNLSDWVKTVNLLMRASEDYNYKFDNFGDSALALLLSNCLVPLRHANLSRSEKKKEFKRICNEPLVIKLLHEVKIDASFKKKILFKLIKYKLYGLLPRIYR